MVLALNTNSTVCTKKATIDKEKVKKQILMMSALLCVMTLVATVCPTFAAGVEGAAQIKEIVDKMVSIIGLIFRCVGVILAVYSVGHLILAFKHEDADSKSRASTMLVVAIVLIALPSIINGLNLTAVITQ